MPPDAAAGDTVRFYNTNSGAFLGQGKVLNLTSITATLDVPASLFLGAIAEWPDHECGGWIIQNCHWHDNYGRVKMKSGPGLIQGCTFERIGGGLMFNFSLRGIIEGGIPSGIVIANNSFTDVSPMPHLAAINCYEAAAGTMAARLITKLRITGNAITNAGEAGINLLAVDGCTIADNNIVNPIRYTALAEPGQSSLQQAIFLSDCANICVLTNNVSDSDRFTVPCPLTSSHVLGIDSQCQNITNRDGILLQ